MIMYLIAIVKYQAIDYPKNTSFPPLTPSVPYQLILHLKLCFDNT